MRLFNEKYSNKPRATKYIFKRVKSNCLQHASFKENFEVTVFAHFRAHRNAFLREANQDLGYSTKTIPRFLKKYHMHPFSHVLVQHLRSGDDSKRVCFANNILIAL